MNDLRLEFGENINQTLCDCCGNKSFTVNGFIFNDEFAHGVYFARWTEKHNEKEIILTICIGEWGDGCNSKNRHSVNLRIKGKEANFGMMFTNSDESPWRDEQLLGYFMERKEILSSETKNEFIRIAEKIIYNVPEIAAYLS